VPTPDTHPRPLQSQFFSYQIQPCPPQTHTPDHFRAGFCRQIQPCPPQTQTPDHFRAGFLAVKFRLAHPRHTPQTILRQLIYRQIQACPPQTIQTNNGSAVKLPKIHQHLQLSKPKSSSRAPPLPRARVFSALQSSEHPQLLRPGSE
jgi:hypothetical protein